MSFMTNFRNGTLPLWQIWLIAAVLFLGYLTYFESPAEPPALPRVRTLQYYGAAV